MGERSHTSSDLPEFPALGTRTSMVVVVVLFQPWPAGGLGVGVGFQGPVCAFH